MAQPQQQEKDVQTLMELREKMEMNGAYLGMVQQQQRRTAVNLRRSQLTLDEIKALPEATPMFKSVGKAYFLAPQAQLAAELSDDVKAATDALAELGKQQARAEKALKDIEAEAAEVTRGNPAATAAFRRLMGAAS